MSSIDSDPRLLDLVISLTCEHDIIQLHTKLDRKMIGDRVDNAPHSFTKRRQCLGGRTLCVVQHTVHRHGLLNTVFHTAAYLFGMLPVWLHAG